MVTSFSINLAKLLTFVVSKIEIATTTKVIVIHEIDAKESEKLRKTLLKESLTFLKNILIHY